MTIESDESVVNGAATDTVAQSPPASPAARVDIALAVRWCASALIVGQLLFRGWLTSRGWFVGDDFAFISRARGARLLDPHYLFRAYNSHVMPGAFAEVWLYTHRWSFDYTPVVITGLVFQTLTAYVVYRILRNLFGPRPLILVPLVIYLFTPITLPAFLWWAAALNQSAQQLALAFAVLCQIRYLRTGRLRYGFLGVLAFGFGLLFSEKSLLVVPLVVGLTLAFFTGGGFWPRLWTSLRRDWKVWAGYALIAVPYAGYYVIGVPTPHRSGASTPGIVQLVIHQFGHAIVPGLFGGPWTWQEISTDSAVANPSVIARYVSLLALALLIAASIGYYRRAVFAWAIAGGYAALNTVLLAGSRAAVVGPLIGSEYRYSTDIAFVAILGGALAYMPIVGSAKRGDVQLLVPRPPAQAWLAQVRRNIAVYARLPGQWVAIVAVAIVFLISAVYSSMGFDKIWHINGAQDYIANAKADVKTAGRHLTLVDQPAPEQVIWGLEYPYTNTRYMLADVGDSVSYLTPGKSTDQLYILDDQGYVRLAGIAGQSNAPGPKKGCGYFLSNKGATTIPLKSQAFPWTWITRIGYISSANVDAQVTVGSTVTSVRFEKGLHNLYVMGDGAIKDVRISALTGPAGICTNDVEVGKPVAIPNTGAR